MASKMYWISSQYKPAYDETYLVYLKNHRPELALYQEGEWDLSGTDAAGLEDDIEFWCRITEPARKETE